MAYKKPVVEPVGLREIAEALAHDHILRIECYCHHQECTVREVQFNVKDYGKDATVDLILMGGMPCPVCGETKMAVHRVLTREELDARYESRSRQSVNYQMYRRDEKQAGRDTLAIPANRWLDDRLPTTPAGWWDKGLDESSE